MINHNKIRSLFIFFTILLNIFYAKGQNLINKRIYVSSSATIQIIFNSKIEKVAFEEPDPFPIYKSLRDKRHENLLTLDATKDAGAKILTVAEGKRNHRFIIIYKEEIVDSELVYDYSSLAKLTTEAAALNATNLLNKFKDPIKTDSNKVAANIAKPPISGTEINTSSDNFYDYLPMINSALSKENFDEAMVAYNKASATKNRDETILKAKLNEINVKRDAKYNDLIARADAASNNKKYDEAITLYNQALSLKKDDPSSKLKLKNVQLLKDADIKRAEEQRLNQQYTNAMADAGDAYKQGLYEKAITLYNEVLKIPGHEKDVSAKSWILLINSKIEEKKNNDLYNNNIKSAEDEYNKGSFENAILFYKEAMTVPGHEKDVVATTQINAINKKIEARAKELIKEKNEAEYNNAIKSGDSAFNAGLLEQAKTAYNYALKIHGGIDVAASSKIKEINDQIKYDALITKADNLLLKKDLLNAEATYKQALAIKPSEQYPKNKLDEIKSIKAQTTAEKELNDKQALADEQKNQLYKTAIIKARSDYQRKNLTLALDDYKAANAIKPNEPEPLAKILEIENKLKEIAKQKEIDDQFDSLKSAASNALQRGINAKDFDVSQSELNIALNAFKQAAALKPTDEYVKKQLDFTSNEIIQSRRKRDYDDSTAVIKAKRKKISEANEKVKLALQNANNLKTTIAWENALEALNELLVLDPTNSYALDRIKAIKDILATNQDKDNSATGDSTKTIPVFKEMVAQASAIPYTEETLKKNYPNIDFANPPSEQTFNSVGNSSLNYTICKLVQAEAPRLNLNNEVNQIKLILEGLTFKGANVYLKFLIQNFSNNPFPVGPMLLTWSRKDGNSSKLLPGYISSFPLIMPNSSYEIVYVTRNVNVALDEYLFFEITDRFKKNKMKIDIPGAVYKKEKDL